MWMDCIVMGVNRRCGGKRIIEDVLTVVDVDWEMVAAIFVLELDAVRGVHFSILDANHARCRLAIEESQALGVALQRDIRQVKRRKSLKRIAWNGEHRACGEEEQLYKAHSICGVAQTRVNEMALRYGRLFSLCVRRDDKVGEDTLLINHVPLAMARTSLPSAPCLSTLPARGPLAVVAVAATCSTIFFTFLPSLRYALLSVSFICRASIALSTSVNSFPSYGWLES